MVTKVTFVGEGFTRKPPKYERFVRPMALRFKKAHVTHPELQVRHHRLQDPSPPNTRCSWGHRL
jgi:ribosome biogenesis protein NSA2